MKMENNLYAIEQKILHYHSKKSKEGMEWKQQNNDNKSEVLKSNQACVDLISWEGREKEK